MIIKRMIFNIFSALLIVMFLPMGVLPANAAAGEFNVTKTADTNDGTCNSDCSLREAITAANGNGPDADTINLPAGTYTLTLGSQLPLVNSVLTINGSGAANTIIQANANPNTATYRIFEVTYTLTLDGLTVRNGNCNGGTCATDLSQGGAIYNAGTLTVINCTFSANAAVSGGGIFNAAAVLLVFNSTFSGNSAVNSGGGIFNNAGTLNVNNSTFSTNTAGSGGGLANDQGNPALTNVIFNNNTASNGGGMVNNNGGNPTLTNVTFSNNAAFTGGGISNQNSAGVLTNVVFRDNTFNTGGNGGGGGIYNLNSSPTLKNVAFIGNSASTYGGGMYNNSNSNPLLTNLTFSGNLATYGGGMYNNNSSPTLTNATFSGNSASNQGGGMSSIGGSPILKNATFSGNTSTFNGGSMYNVSSSPHIFNGIFWGNGTVEIDNHGSSATMVYSIVQGGCPAGSSLCSNVINLNPNLGPLQNNGGFTRTMSLGAGSAAIDAGDNTSCSSKDQRGIARPQGTKCDIGAFEVEMLSLTLRSQGANDGWVLESTEISGVGGLLNAAATTFNLGDNAADKQYRAILSFNTATLPDNAVITKVTLRIKKQGQVGTNPFTILGGLTVDIRKPYFGTASLAASDFQAAAGISAVATFNATPVSNWYSALLNTNGRAYVNKTGATQFRLRFSTDDNNDNGADLMSFISGNHATASVRPTLIIEYYVP